jgi:hypothetical protein
LWRRSAHGFDLGQIETRKYAEEGKLFPIRHPVIGADGATVMEPVLDDKGEPLQIRISGADASRIKNAVEQRQRARREAIAAVKPGETAPDFNSWEVREQDVVDDLVLLTEGWTDNFELDGKPFPFSKDNAAVLYKRFPEIAAQMTEVATNRMNFTPALSKK